MGQQQLILLVLAVVIVGLAIVVGIRAFSENNVKANSDAMVQDALRIASDAQAWMIKPQAFGGSLDANKATLDWTGVTLEQLGYPIGTVDGCAGYGNTTGCYTITAAGAANFVLNGTTVSSASPLATALAAPNVVDVTVTGIEDDLITTAITIGNY